MTDMLLKTYESRLRKSANRVSHFDWKRLPVLYLRLALGASFLSGIADRFGLYTGRNVGYGNFAGFVEYTAKVNAFVPTGAIPFLAWAATVLELLFGLALVFGFWVRWCALGSSILLLLFAAAMAISFGIKSPLDYSVFSASAGSLFLAFHEFRRHTSPMTEISGD